MADLDFKKIEQKWQSAWDAGKIFEADAHSKKPKFFINFPYPYVNAYLHLGHAYSATRVDVMARFKRMQGFNTLFPQAWHCTGTPITAAARRVKEGEPKQIKILKDMGFSDSEIKKFSDPVYWTSIFPKEAEKDFRRLGASVDWRRSFITTYLNPYYDKFIAWQFKTLREKGYVDKGEHPVVWCPKDETVVGDHDRSEGEGETPQEYTLLKFKFGKDKEYLVAATLRPETIFGETNFWVNPDIDYVKAKVGGEEWVVSESCAEKLKNQGKKVAITGRIKGKDLVGKSCTAPIIGRELLILPAKFCDPNVGTGLVTSVPSDAPFDYVALRDIQENESEMKKYGLDAKNVKSIKPIPIIENKEWGELPAVKIVDQWKIKNQHDKKLDEATQVIYKAGFYAGKMNKNCGEYTGLNVDKAKEKIKEALIKKGLADNFYELSGKVVCRCLTPSLVKIVSDQWFLKYGDKDWKNITKKALDKMTLYPATVRQQFEYVLDWLKDWACVHHHGLGSYLPWDKKWVIESLSDSTAYMSYYTIAHKLEEVDIKKIDDSFFDYVLLGKGKKPNIKGIDVLRKEFDYWYPFDMRSTAKDLVQNHMSFCLFNHTALFPEKDWPKSFAVNGWLLVNGEKMSKSKGNFFTIRQMLDQYSADVTRSALMMGGEGLEDPNFDMANANSLAGKFQWVYDFASEQHSNGSAKSTSADAWLESVLNRTVKEVTEAMEQTAFRTAFEKALFGLSNSMKWYVRRVKPNKKLMNLAIETQIKLIAPFAPHFSEELWNKLGKKTFVALEKWPEADAAKMSDEAETAEKSIESSINDIKHIIKLIGKKGEKEPTKIYLYTVPKELQVYSESKDFISKELSVKVETFAVNDKNKHDPTNKATKARPGKPAIYAE